MNKVFKSRYHSCRDKLLSRLTVVTVRLPNSDLYHHFVARFWRISSVRVFLILAGIYSVHMWVCDVIVQLCLYRRFRKRSLTE